MKLTFLGHAALQLETNGKTLIFDPFISGNSLAKDIDINSLKADYILLTHGHEDHVADAEQIANNTGAKLISNFEVINWFTKKNIEGHPMNHGGMWEFDFGTVKMVNAIHSSSMPDGSYGGNPAGFVVWNDEISFYVAGDTALTQDMKLIPLTTPKLDFCVLPIGDNFTMGYEEAIMASDFIKCDTIIAYHYDTFGYIVVDKEMVKKEFEERGKKIIFLEIGESIEF